MLRSKPIVMACSLALMAGCAKNNKSEKPMARNVQAPAQAQTQAQASGAAAAVAPAFEPGKLAGAWRLAMPRTSKQQSAVITAADGNEVTLEAGEGLSGKYVVQGQYLLILTHDERLRPLAWRINSPDSLTVVRAPEAGATGTDVTGVTLLRAPADVAETEEDTDESLVDTEALLEP